MDANDDNYEDDMNSSDNYDETDDKTKQPAKVTKKPSNDPPSGTYEWSRDDNNNDDNDDDDKYKKSRPFQPAVAGCDEFAARWSSGSDEDDTADKNNNDVGKWPIPFSSAAD